jgi:hypothetical protein
MPSIFHAPVAMPVSLDARPAFVTSRFMPAAGWQDSFHCGHADGGAGLEDLERSLDGLVPDVSCGAVDGGCGLPLKDALNERTSAAVSSHRGITRT